MVMCFTQASGCNGNDSIQSVSAPVFDKEIKSDAAKLLDVRTPKEYAEGHIEGALNIDVQSDDFKRRLRKNCQRIRWFTSTVVAVGVR